MRLKRRAGAAASGGRRRHEYRGARRPIAAAAFVLAWPPCGRSPSRARPPWPRPGAGPRGASARTARQEGMSRELGLSRRSRRRCARSWTSSARSASAAREDLREPRRAARAAGERQRRRGRGGRAGAQGPQAPRGGPSALREAEQKAIRAILTPEQQKKFDKFQGPRRGPGGRPGPGPEGWPGPPPGSGPANRGQRPPFGPSGQPPLPLVAPEAQRDTRGAPVPSPLRRAPRGGVRPPRVGGRRAPGQQRKDAKLLAEAKRALDPWERYRALVDALEEGIDLAEMADRKVRFAMVVMASLNIGVFALTTRLRAARPRGDVVARLARGVPAGLRRRRRLLLRAGRGRAAAADARTQPGASRTALVRGLAASGASTASWLQDVADYARSWRDVRFEQLHNELALQNHRLAQVNEEKYAALGRLYGGLRVLAVLFGGLVLFAGVFPARRRARRTLTRAPRRRIP